MFNVACALDAGLGARIVIPESVVVRDDPIVTVPVAKPGPGVTVNVCETGLTVDEVILIVFDVAS